MAIGALITWLVAAAGGFVLLGTWIARGGGRSSRNSKFPPTVLFGHLVLAVAGLVLWIIYVVIDNHTLAWISFALLILVALLGLTMFARWLPTYRTPLAGNSGESEQSRVPAEKHFPIAVVAGHGLFAVATLVLVLLAALEVGG